MLPFKEIVASQVKKLVEEILKLMPGVNSLVADVYIDKKPKYKARIIDV